jgi:hypothetical protein
MGVFFTFSVQLFKKAKVSVEEFHRFNDKENEGYYTARKSITTYLEATT